ncbi:DUF2948 family protein [Sulfitobacter mediterraneus]|uniref:DUF2948 family protein n=1 Tax=Sulfitobacter mediterraneus TaxID=83219 RepID=UPI001931BBD8|nr:DUF2948 family protein [Sulfitobacter mediterraneus]MBM1311170.1 DUF2948 family protein [Sulfitobacter mediterraneus]MBM1315052.1 DUF2948 family protein [Sulfitobacter mediterraneus]MBM1323413.1 DUF2948 family protein [Sulfitobacter mediterraneus]MBM1327325.1 DUF2948 family protein [Sulfitobacter mediterraneus]MBM1398673.1 DUF2948 family protein [Sulfitobacter mediterraneus]
MSMDARFEDGREAPLNLGALDEADLEVISSLTQDAVFPASEMTWDSKGKRFALLLNRVRWEDDGKTRHAPERVQSVLLFSNVQSVASQGVPKGDADVILSLLNITFEEADAPSGHVLLTLAGDGAIRLAVEALEATLKDVTRPYVAPSKKLPDHPE